MQDKEPRWVDLGWSKIEGAKEYEVEILNNSSNKIVFKKLTYDINISVQLIPGVYQFKIRAIDKRGIPAPWSEYSQINVNLPAPILVSPYTDQSIKALNLHIENITFDWQDVRGAKAYQIDIWNRDKSFKESFLANESDFSLKLKTATNYFWSVKSLESEELVTSDFTNGRGFNLKGGKIDYPHVKILEEDKVVFQWDQVDLAQYYELYLFKKQLNNKWELVKKIDQYQSTTFSHGDEGLYRLALRSVARGFASSSYAFIEFSFVSKKLDLLLNRVQVEVDVSSDNPFFYAYGIETMSLEYQGNYAEADTDINSSLIGYRVFLEGSYQNFYSYLRHRLGINTHLLKNLDEYIYLSEMFYMVGQKKIYRNIPYELSVGAFLKEDIFIEGDRIENEIDYSRIVTSGLLVQIESWYKLTRRIELGFNLKIYSHLLRIETPNDNDIESTFSHQIKVFSRYNLKENLSLSLFYGLYQSNTSFVAQVGDNTDPNSNSLAASGSLNESESTGTSLGLVLNSSF